MSTASSRWSRSNSQIQRKNTCHKGERTRGGYFFQRRPSFLLHIRVVVLRISFQSWVRSEHIKKSVFLSSKFNVSGFLNHNEHGGEFIPTNPPPDKITSTNPEVGITGPAGTSRCIVPSLHPTPPPLSVLLQLGEVSFLVGGAAETVLVATNAGTITLFFFGTCIAAEPHGGLGFERHLFFFLTCTTDNFTW